MRKKHVNSQREAQLVAEWLSTLPSEWKTKTHIFVGEQTLVYNGVPLTPAERRAFVAWSDWVDARVVTPSEIWIVEGKLVATGAAYGQVLDYVNQYPTSADYLQWPGRDVIPVVVCQAERPRTAALFASLGVRTIVFEPTFSLESSLEKLFQGTIPPHDRAGEIALSPAPPAQILGPAS